MSQDETVAEMKVSKLELSSGKANNSAIELSDNFS